jgi:hypothetical protein
VGDTGYGTSETARFCQQHRRHLTLVRKFDSKAAWYEHPPPRTRHTIGRPRVKGQKLPSPQEVVTHRARRTRLAVAWYGGPQCREHLKRESPKCYGQQTVLRFTPCLFGRYPIIVVRYLQLPDLLRLPIVMSWRGKSTTTFADMLTCVRRSIWQQWLFQTPMKAEPFSKLPRSLQETILYALAPTA